MAKSVTFTFWLGPSDNPGGLLIVVPSAHADCGNLGGVTLDVNAVPAYPGDPLIYVFVIENPALSGYTLAGQPFCLPVGTYTLTSGLYAGWGANIGPNAGTFYQFGSATCVGTTSYLYDAYGRLEKVVDPLQGVTLYAYDAMSQLTSLTDANGHTTARL